jgi:DNA-binding LacI/PurR family transcriptional regulator
MAQRLRREIADGTYSRGSYLPPLRRLADCAGVAYLTASRALKVLEQEGLVVAEPRKGYRVLRSGTKPGSPRALFGFLASSAPDDTVLWGETHKALLAGFQCAAGHHGLGIVVMRYDRQSPRDLAKSILEAGLAGVAIDSDRPELVEALRAAKIPHVLVDAFTYDAAADGVVQDNFRGGFLAGGYLAKRGHREVAWFGLSHETIHSQERLGGALIGLRTGDARLRENFIFRVPEIASGIPAEEALCAARKFLAARGRPSAILALWQSCANAVLTAASELRLTPGRDFDLITWGIEENRQGIYAQRFPQGHIPPMVCWSAKCMAEMALGRLVTPLDAVERTPVRISVPMRLWA